MKIASTLFGSVARVMLCTLSIPRGALAFRMDSKHSGGSSASGNSSIGDVAGGRVGLPVVQTFADLRSETEKSFGSMIAELQQQVETLMCGAADLTVPLTVETGIGANWDEAH